MNISIEVLVNSSLQQAWIAWTSPDHIVKWNFASDDWHCPSAAVELQVGGQYSSRMEAKDGSMGFDFKAQFTQVIDQQRLEYVLEDDRKVTVEFLPSAKGVQVIETFEAESENSPELQRQGWQSILNNFKQHVESAHA